jgi:hypothetical protein
MLIMQSNHVSCRPLLNSSTCRTHLTIPPVRYTYVQREEMETNVTVAFRNSSRRFPLDANLLGMLLSRASSIIVVYGMAKDRSAEG